MIVLVAIAVILYVVLFVASVWLAYTATPNSVRRPGRGSAPTREGGGRGTALPLPHGPDGHLMAAQAIHEATSRYVDWCEAELRGPGR
jgi:hypothetical protein